MSFPSWDGWPGVLGVEFAVIQAVAQVESARSGFFKNGAPKILFEGHIFWQMLEEQKIDPEEFAKDPNNKNILYKKWVKDHYQKGQRS